MTNASKCILCLIAFLLPALCAVAQQEAVTYEILELSHTPVRDMENLVRMTGLDDALGGRASAFEMNGRKYLIVDGTAEFHDAVRDLVKRYDVPRKTETAPEAQSSMLFTVYFVQQSDKSGEPVPERLADAMADATARYGDGPYILRDTLAVRGDGQAPVETSGMLPYTVEGGDRTSVFYYANIMRHPTDETPAGRTRIQFVFRVEVPYVKVDYPNDLPRPIINWREASIRSQLDLAPGTPVFAGSLTIEPKDTPHFIFIVADAAD